MHNINWNNMHDRIPKRRKKREEGSENLAEEGMFENFPNVQKERDVQLQEAQRVPKKMNPKRYIPRHITN